MVEVIHAPNAFSVLSARPPTPPRDGRRKRELDANATAVPNFGNGGLWPDSTLHTPPSHSSLLNSTAAGSSVERPRKRVKFDRPDGSSPGLARKNASVLIEPKHLPPSRERTSTKSILKPCDRPIPLVISPRRPLDHRIDSSKQCKDLVTMLESIVQELSGMSRSSKLDAYVTLGAVLKAYDGTPSPEYMGSKVNLLLTFILRDLSAVLPGTEIVDTALIVQALKLLSIFIWQPTILLKINTNSCIIITDKAIEALGADSQMPKVLVTQYMRILGQQKFSQKVMTQERAVRLIRALDLVTDHIKGNGVVGERLIVYQRLLQQVRPVMISNVEDWCDNVISAMLSGFKEIRSRAIALSIEAGLLIGHIPHASGSVLGVFDRSLDDGMDFATKFARRLDEMRVNKDECQHVPQIWSAIILYFQTKQHRFQKWKHFDLWRQILQKCFNSSDTAVKFQANLAWNKLVFIINPSENTEYEMIKMLRSPISGQLERRSSEKSAKDAKKFALSALCNLLYYCFRPGSSFQQLDLYWKFYVTPLFKDILFKSRADSKYGCGILSMLLDSSRVRTWDMNRANEGIGLLKPEELPKLDERWTRSRSRQVLDVLSAALRTSTWSLSVTSPAPFEKLWINFLRMLSEASSKEVMVSQELMDCVATFLDFFVKIWKGGKSALVGEAESADDEFIKRFDFLVANAVSILGTLCFTEKSVLQNGTGSFEAASKPVDGQSHPPIIHLFRLFVVPPAGVITTSSYYQSLRDLLKTCCKKRGSRRAQIELIQDCLQMLPLVSKAQEDLDHYFCLWRILAEISTDLAKDHFHGIEPRENSTFSSDCLGFVKVLQWPCRQAQMDQLESWKALFDSLTNSVEQFAGDVSVALVIIEPIAEVLGSDEIRSDSAWLLLPILLDAANYTDNLKTLEAAHRRLWGVQAGSKNSLSQPICHLPLLLKKVLSLSYSNALSRSFIGLAPIISSLSAILARRLGSSFNTIIKHIQEPMSVWIEDADDRLTTEFEEMHNFTGMISFLWMQVLDGIQKLLPHNDELLQRFELLVASGFASRRRNIVKSTVAFWNQTFGLQQAIAYPPTVLQAILRIRRNVELLLPTFPGGLEDVQHDSPEWTVESETTRSGASPKVVPSRGKGGRVKRARESAVGASSSRQLRSQKSMETLGGQRQLRRTSQRISKSSKSPKRS